MLKGGIVWKFAHKVQWFLEISPSWRFIFCSFPFLSFIFRDGQLTSTGTQYQRPRRYVIDAIQANVTLIENELVQRGYVPASGSLRARKTSNTLPITLIYVPR